MLRALKQGDLQLAFIRAADDELEGLRRVALPDEPLWAALPTRHRLASHDRISLSAGHEFSERLTLEGSAEVLRERDGHLASGLIALDASYETGTSGRLSLGALEAFGAGRAGSALRFGLDQSIGLSERTELTFGLTAISGGFQRPAFDVEPGQVIEVSEQQAAFGRDLGALIQAASGAALLIDYGRARPEAGDTLQALRRHQKVDPLATPGQADLTQWADFPLVLEAALRAGADVTGCVNQGDFLKRLGIEARAQRLIQSRPEAAPIIGRQLDRLTAPDQMGDLFKAAAIFSPRTLALPGFET